jgi:hypothetical protein
MENEKGGKNKMKLCETVKNIQARKKTSGHEYKENTVKKYAEKYSCNTLIETGTCKGTMLLKTYDNFRNLYSVEIADKLYDKARETFATYDNVHLYYGDSAKMLSTMIRDAMQADKNSKFIFWLDGHYSGGETGKGIKDTPIIEELSTIRKMKVGGVILIDDARCFINYGSFKDYPTIKQLKSKVKMWWPSASFYVKKDVIRIIIN